MASWLPLFSFYCPISRHQESSRRFHLAPLLFVAIASETNRNFQRRRQGFRYGGLASQHQVLRRLLSSSTECARLVQLQSLREPGIRSPGSRSTHAGFREEPAACQVTVPGHLLYCLLLCEYTPSGSLVDALALLLSFCCFFVVATPLNLTGKMNMRSGNVASISPHYSAGERYSCIGYTILGPMTSMFPLNLEGKPNR